jgi:hypothetical protein
MKSPSWFHFPEPKWRRPGRKAIVILCILALFLVVAGYKSYAGPPRGPMGEEMPPDEPAYASRIIDSGIRLLSAVHDTAADGLYRRDAHAKTHACLIANFSVRNGLNDDVRQGVFAQPKSYKAWVRFSSGSEQLRSDWLPDARGMAIKLLGVPGQKLLDGEQHARTQDFLMINNPVFFIPDVEEYAAFTSSQAGGNQFAYFFQPPLNPFQWKLRQFRIGMNVLKWPPKQLLGTQFYSMTAYRLGATHNVKHSAKPVSCDGTAPVSSGWASFGWGALRADLAAEIKAKPACFDLMVQLQMPEKNMPVEDPTVEWSESDSPFIPVARVEIPKQDIAPALADNFCENLSFTPWHALPAHEPIGGLNRVRKAVYQGIARYRRCLNGIAYGEPEENGAPRFEMKACDPHDAVPPIPPPSGTKPG